MLRHFSSQLITHNSQFLLFALFLMPFALYSQSPQGFNYQAVVRDAGGQIVKEQAVGLRLTLLQGSETGTPVYSETHQVTTNALGLVSMVVGRGTVESGDFSKIDWENGPYYLKVEADLTGGSNYESLGVSALMSVPYALQAGTVGSLTRLEVQGDDPDSDSALFVVRRKDGQTVFAVYNEGVRIYVDTAGTAQSYGVFLRGKGLWGTIGAFGVITADLTKMKGIDFIEQVETPGLGARITENEFKYFFRGLDLGGFANGNVGTQVIKMVGRKEQSNVVKSENTFQAITGATQTCMGVANMVNADMRFLIELLRANKNQLIQKGLKTGA